MKAFTIVLVAATAITAVSAQAETVLSGSLGNVASNGNGIATTTTTANGTTTTVTGPGGGGNRATATPTIGSWYQSEVGGGGTVGITKTYTNDGNGAAYFAGTNGDSKGDLAYNFAAPVLLSSLTTMSYDFYRAATSTVDPNLAPVMRLNIFKGTDFAGSLVLENVYQNQTPAPVGAWTTVGASLNSGILWATNSRLGPTFAAANGGQKTFADWISANAGSTLTVTGMSIGFGSGWNGSFAGAIDNVKIGFTGGPNAAFDFAVGDATAPVPEPATWAMMIAGFGATGVALRRRKSVRTRVSFV